MKCSIVIEGGKELESNLATLGRRINKKVIRGAVRAGQRPMLSAAKANAKSMVGGEMGKKIAKALQIRAAKEKESGFYSIDVKISRDYNDQFVYYLKGSHTKVNFSTGKLGKEVGRTYIPAAIEYGHMTGGTYVQPIPYLRNAAESTRDETIRRFVAELRKGMLREAIKGRYA